MVAPVPSSAGHVGRRAPVVPNGVLGMAIFVVVEIMFFAGLISAYLITRASTLPVLWPPPSQPRLPVEVTGANSVLLASGVLMTLAALAFRSTQAPAPPGRGALRYAAGAFALGALFLGVQGWEWVRLIAEGLTLTTSVHGSFFYVIVGIHALHVIGALGGLGWVVLRLKRGVATQTDLAAMQVLWTFVVLVWPVLYVMVYL
jgi:cytochrome c oxidase subunit III